MKKQADNLNQKATYKESIIVSISQSSGLSKADSTRAFKGMLQSIQKGLQEDKRVRITGFGTFRVSHRPARKGRNPYTGESLQIPATKYPVFRTGKALRGWGIV